MTEGRAGPARFGVTFLVLLVLLRSIVLPVKAVLMNALSIGATFGALVWIFQDGHLLVAEARPIEPTLPVLLFCTSFGLSMDYEVLMLARMKEAWARTRDNTCAVEEGLENTAGLITSAAAIMIAVFAAFALARIVLLQATGTASRSPSRSARRSCGRCSCPPRCACSAERTGGARGGCALAESPRPERPIREPPLAGLRWRTAVDRQRALHREARRIRVDRSSPASGPIVPRLGAHRSPGLSRIYLELGTCLQCR